MQSTFCHSRAACATEQDDARLERAAPHAPDTARTTPAYQRSELGHRFGDVSVASRPVIARGFFDDAYLPFDVLHQMSNAWTSSGHHAANIGPTNPGGLGNPSTWGEAGGFPGRVSEQVSDSSAPGSPDIPTPATAGMAFGVGGSAPVGDVTNLPAEGGGSGGLLDLFGGA